MSEKRTHTRLDPVAFGLAIGIPWGLGLLFMGVMAWLTGYGASFVAAIGGVYLGYAASLVGSVIGAVWGLADGFVFGALVGWIYNWLRR